MPKKNIELTLSRIRKGIDSKPLLMLTSLPILFFIQQASAQDQTIVVEDSLGIEKIQVTAQKRTQSIQEVPISLIVMSDSDIEKAAANTLSDLNFAIPGLSISGDSQGGVSIRGVSGFARNVGSEGRAGIYTDEVYVGRSAGVDQNLFDIERVEVLKGPQGTLFGRNTVSGAISITTRKPQEEFEGSVKLETGNLGRLNGTAIVNVPLTDSLFSRVSLNSIKQDGYVTNITTNNDVGSFEKLNGRLQLRYLAKEDLTFDLSIDARRSRKDTIGFQTFTDSDTNGIRAITHDADEFDNNTLYGISLTAEYILPTGFIFKSITSYREEEYHSLNDEDASSLDVAISQFQEDNNQFTQELRLQSPDLDAFNYIVGLYYLGEDLSSDKSVSAGTAFPIPNVDIPAPGDVNLDSYAAYVHSNYSFTDKLFMTAGLRYTKETKSADYSISDPTGILFTTGTYKDEKSWDDLSPKIGLQYKASNNLMVYGSIARAFKAGGYNLDFLSSLDQVSYDPETAVNYEIGIKSDLINRRLRLNASVFSMKFDDYQVFQFQRLASGGTISVLTNASSATSSGIELEVSARPLKELMLVANYTHIKAEYDEFPDGGGLGIDYDGQPISSTPDQSFYIGADYDRELDQYGSVNFHLGFSYNKAFDKFINLSLREPISSQKSLNAHIEFRTTDESTTLAIWSKNMTSEEAASDVSYNFLGSRYASYPISHTYGISLKYNF
ncbi:MAG: TonB-dependent receptor [Paraglaciecola sp.]|uniref:TonB-dependent receptor n=1 Tax=Paraglaciecola sp. TaxID=1920173 RepID=UPI00329783A3